MSPRQSARRQKETDMTDHPLTDTGPNPARRLAGRLRRRQQDISDRVHADGDASALAHGWTVIATTGRLGMGGRTYRDRRFSVAAANGTAGM